ncbi:MAG TPA: lysophospholipid acyltransferase family protein [Thermoanaerobaculia bacterium]
MATAGKGGLLQLVEYAIYRTITAMISIASAATARRWGRRIGRLSARLLTRRTHLAFDNLRRTFPEKTAAECRAIALACWEHFGETLLEYFRTQREPIEEIVARFDIANREILDSAIAAQRGVVIISAHFGSWEFGAALLSTLDMEITAVARLLDNKYLQRDVLRARERSGVNIVDRRRAARSLVKTLERGGAVVMLPDQAVKPHEGILVPFLGRDAWTSPAAARLTLRYGAPIVGAFCYPNGERFRLELTSIDPAILPESERTTEAVTRRINDMISERVRRTPELWLWMHNRWKGSPSL